MNDFHWQNIIQTNIMTLKIVGLWPKGDKTYEFNLYTLWSIFTLIFINLGHNLFQVIKLIILSNDLRAVVRISYVTLSEIIAFVKAYYFIKHMKILKSLMVTLRSNLFQPKNQSQIAMVEGNFSFWKNLSILVWTMSAGAIFFWAVRPIFEKSDDAFPLPFLAWYPWSTKRWPNYQLTYLHQVFGVMFIASTAISTDMLLAALNVCIGAQFDILTDNVIHMFDYKKDSFFDMNRKLIRCVEHHRQILRFARKTNIIGNWIILVQFFVSAVTIGITLFLVTVTEPFGSEFYSCISFTFSMIMQVFMYCWFGNEIEVKSEQLIYAIFKSSWTDTSREIKKNIIFFSLRCSKPLKMSALKLFYVSLDTFMKILRTAWSYFALLHQISTR